MLVLDANIPIRAVLGKRVLYLLRKYSNQTEFFAPDVVFQDARRHLPTILERRGLPVAPGIAVFDSLSSAVQTVGIETYVAFESPARQRLAPGMKTTAGAGVRSGLELQYLDRGLRLLRLRRGDLDNRSSGTVPGGCRPALLIFIGSFVS